MPSAATASVPSSVNAISTHGRGDTMSSPRYFLGGVGGCECMCVRGERRVREGVRYPQGRAAQIQGNKNASIFGRAFVSPDS